MSTALLVGRHRSLGVNHLMRLPVAAIAGKFGLHERRVPLGYGTSDDPAASYRQLIIRDKVRFLFSKSGDMMIVDIGWQTFWVMQWLAGVSTGFTKLSVLFFYRRIFVGNTFNAVNWSLIVLSTIFTISSFIANLRKLCIFSIFLFSRPDLAKSTFFQ